jgi:glycosyltransferase involved in cell wall biosynthesis
VRFVYDVQDLWPESALASGLMRPGLLVDAMHRLADWVYARAHRILVVSRAAAGMLERRGVAAEKILVAPHWIDAGAFGPSPVRDVRREYGWNGRFVVMFAGNLGMVQGLETVIDAAALLRDRADTEFVFVGDGSDRERLERTAADRGLSNVRFVGRHPASEMPAFLGSADALLVHLRNSDIADHAIPTKILAYLAAARPIVCAMRGPAAELVNEAGAGLTTPPGDAAALAGAIRQLQSMPSQDRDRMGRNGRDYVRSHLDRSRVVDLYEDVLCELAGVHRVRSEVASQC